ncbi:DUF456 domain-containing protein [Desulfovibrio sp. OttesenSCG-928-A18]|nr:DUF456 domain-containing protein [Desulfovibrio sp. OttesenSCG-928-A18]
MLYILAIICIALMILSLMLLFLGLPGNWIILGLAALWTLVSGTAFGWEFFLPLIGLALAGEAAEFLAGHFGARRFGASGKGSAGGMVGALAGGLVCAPLFFGLGALLGAMAGGFIGCFVVEKGRGAKGAAAARAAFGATLGRFGGFVVKLGIGIGIIWTAAPRIWESIA